MDYKKIIDSLNKNIVLKNLLLTVFIVVFLLAIIFTSLRIYTHHGEALTVPDLTGLTVKEAEKILTEKNFSFVVFDSVFVNDFEKGTVVEQHPVAGFKVKRKRKIFITVNAMNPEKIVMPNLIQLTIRRAQAKLESFGLKLGQIYYEPDISVNMVLAQKYKGREINPGDTIIKGSFIDLVLGKGLSNESSMVPNLIGLTLEEATLKASDAFLRIGGAVPDPGVPEKKKANALVYRQRPEHNKSVRIPLGSSVDVWLTLDSTKIAVEQIDTLNYDPNDSLR